MSAVYKKELRSFFTNMTGYVFIAFILLMAGLFCWTTNLKGGYPYFEYALGSISFAFIFVVPILTMRAFAEERHQKTDQLLYSLPISVNAVVVGKYLAMLTVFGLTVAVMCFYPIILGFYGTVYYAATYSSIFGFFLLGAALIAVGMFMSTLTESQVISAVISLAAVLLIYLMGGLSSMIPSTAIASFIAFTVLILAFAGIVYIMTKNSTMAYIIAIAAEAVIFVLYFVKPSLFAGAFNKVLSSISLFDRFNTFVSGMFDISSVVYYLSVIFLFVFFSVQAVEKRRWS